MKFMHISDVHLGYTPDKGKPWSEARAKEIEQTFKDVVRIAEKEEVDLLLIAGDLFHAPPTFDQLEDVDVILSQLSKTRTVMIAGSHDYIDDGSTWEGYKWNSKTVVLPKNRVARVYIKSLDTYIAGRSYYRPEISLGLYNACRPSTTTGTHILLAHGGDPKHSPMKFDKMKNAGFDYIALGHRRQPSKVVPGKMEYSGSLEPLGAKDTGNYGYILGEIDELGCRTQWIPINKRHYIDLYVEANVTMTGNDIRAMVEKEIKKNGKDNIYRVVVGGKVNKDVVVNLDILSRNYNISHVVDETKNPYNISKLMEENKDNIIGQFIRQYYGKKDPVSQLTLARGLEALMASGSRG